MGELIFIREVQLIFVLLPILQDGRYNQLAIKVGPFRRGEDLEAWKANFLDTLQDRINKQKQIVDCAKPREYIEPYDPDDIAISFPKNPSLMCDGVISWMLLVSSEKSAGHHNEYIFWNAIIRFEIRKPESYLETEVSFGPFENLNEFSAWWSKFLRGVRQRAAKLKGVRFKTLKGETSRSNSPEFSDCGRETDYVVVECLSPRTEGEYFCSEYIQDWLLIHAGGE